MLSKYKNNEILKPRIFEDNLDFGKINYEKDMFVPKTNLYDLYFKQQRNNYLLNTVKVTGLSYVGGCFFGVIMLAFQMLGASQAQFMPSGGTEQKYKHENFQQLAKAALNTFKTSVHRNGVFVVRFSLAIALFNALMMPFAQSKFGDLYGYGNLDTLFNFVAPAYVLVKFNNCSILRKFTYCMLIVSLYNAFKYVYVKEWRDEIKNKDILTPYLNQISLKKYKH